VIRVSFVVAVLALVLAPAAIACNPHPSLTGMEGQIMCPVCGTTLDQSDSPAAHQIEGVIARRIAAGDSDCQIKDRLVAQYGESILAAPPRKGWGLLAWWLPIAGIVVAAALLGVGAWRWSRRGDESAALDPSRNGHGVLDPALERRVDEELARFDG
jgi:cytochrome c-type biogenesis protein CcmH